MHGASMGGCPFGFSGGAAVLRLNNIWSTPPIQKSTIETTLMVPQPTPGFVFVCQICNGLSIVSSHCTPHKNIVQAYLDVQADAQANPHIEGTGEDVILPQCKIPGVGSSLVLSFALVKQACNY